MSVITAYVRLEEEALAGLLGNPEWLEAVDAGRVRGAATMDVDKAGDGLVWLLLQLKGSSARTDLAPLLSGEGGREEPDLETPYGDPARVLTHEQVRAIGAWLTGLDTRELRAAYDPKAMARAGVYPQIWVQQGSAAFEEYVLPHFERLQKFVADAVTASQCMVVYFT